MKTVRVVKRTTMVRVVKKTRLVKEGKRYQSFNKRWPILRRKVKDPRTQPR